jgi:hypothetical protein
MKRVLIVVILALVPASAQTIELGAGTSTFGVPVSGVTTTAFFPSMTAVASVASAHQKIIDWSAC